ncbi:MAG: D-alanyl-D-alanine carboxypeptidase [Clostridia bacterium]|nr:D-alanyl-D-alanine carboxypeptidase [Clostridia bacterium]
MKKLLSALVLLALLMLPVPSRAEEIATSAKACVIVDEITGRVLLSHNAASALPMASTTKVMTALLAIEQGDLEAPVTCSRNAFGVPGTSIYLAQGETLSLRHMLYGLMLASGNDAATAIAEHIGGSVDAFCQMMTARAVELGCQNTVFLTPHGLPQDGHYTTAYDLALIAREAMTHPFFRELVGTQRATIPWEGREYDRVLNNKNRLLSTYEGATGIKTGYTKKAGRCLVFGAERNSMRIIGVVLNCPDWFDEAARLMDAAFDRYEAVTLLRSGDRAGTLHVNMSDGSTVDAVLSADLTGVIPKGSVPGVEIDLPDAIDAPVEIGQQLGFVRMTCGGVTVCEAPLTASASIARDDFPARWRTYWQNWLLLP